MSDRTNRATCLIFVTTDCPICNAYQPTINRLVKTFRKKGVTVTEVNVDPNSTEEAILRHKKDFKITSQIYWDKDHKYTDLYKVEVTPTAVLLDKDRAVVYKGRIDDTFASLGVRRTLATHPDLENAIKAILKGAKPETATTKAVGCLVPNG